MRPFIIPACTFEVKDIAVRPRRRIRWIIPGSLGVEVLEFEPPPAPLPPSKP